ncbi:MAG: hydrogenase expression/formation protein HypE [Halodesulfurarchaeum sp.]
MHDTTISQDHGTGTEATRELLEEYVVPRFGGTDEFAVDLAALDDGAVLPVGERALVITTDSHVVDPIEFPGGDIGRLAVSGTVNDLAVMGATGPVTLTSSVIVEDGFDLPTLDRVFESMAETCEEANCRIVAGDTKVMEGGDIDGLVLNTAGFGLVRSGEHVTDAGLSVGDRVLVSGTIGDHGISLLAARDGMGFEEDLESDVAPVNDLVEVARGAGEITAMKDPTRGGLATVLNEMAEKAAVGLEIEESAIPVSSGIEGAGEILGIDPLEVANEGKVVFTAPAEDTEHILEALRSHPQGREAAIVGEVVEAHPGDVVLETGVGRRFLSEPVSDPLPRIC